MNIKDIPDSLRKLATDLRDEAKKIGDYKTVKSAQVLLAAQGLAKLEEIMHGEGK